MQIPQPDSIYHIFNHANGFENLFLHEANYSYFLEKLGLYIAPVADVVAYCLMPNHFHLIVQFKDRETIEMRMVAAKEFGLTTNTNTFSKVSNFGKGIRIRDFNDDAVSKYLSKQFSNLFSCYTQSFNKVYQRRGSLFVKNFKRELIEDQEYLLNAVVYTHRNPVHHGFCTTYASWPYSSYTEVVFNRKGITNPLANAALLGDLESLKQRHEQSLEKLSLVMKNKFIEL